MILPTTESGALWIMLAAVLCWAIWANSLKLAGKWRFEFYYYDFSLGVLVAAVAGAFTFGEMGGGIAFSDNLAIVRKMQILMAVAAGGVFNLGNILLVGAASISGLGLALPVSSALAVITALVWTYVYEPVGNPALSSCGAVLVASAAAAQVVAYRSYRESRRRIQAAADTAAPKPKKTTGRWNSTILSVSAGLLLGSFYPLVINAHRGEIPMEAYPLTVMFAVGAFLSTFIYNLYFLNMPVQGAALPMLHYFRGSLPQHAWGIAGGLAWGVGALCCFLIADSALRPRGGMSIIQAAGMLHMIWGWLIWKEYEGADSTVKLLSAAMVAMFGIGLGLIVLALP